MPVITSISGIRGTIGGTSTGALTPPEIIKFVSAYGTIIKRNSPWPVVIVGRDARISGKMIENLVCGTLMALGIDVINIGMATTPTTEIAVILEKADGGIIITASHNPKNWNALKLLNNQGEFIDNDTGKEVVELANKIEDIKFEEVENLGQLTKNTDYIHKHIDMIKELELVDVEAIKNAGFTVVVDTINSVGAIATPMLLKELGVKNIITLNNIPNGDFSHNPEPLPENLVDLSNSIIINNADVGFAVDPDVDRLAIISENGEMFGEEYTLVAIADYILSQKKGNTVSNLSSSRALRDVTQKYGQEYFAAAVGELNVVEKMKATNAIIGGEGNGGVIYPELHYGRDSLVGIAMFLTYMAKKKMKVSEIRKQFPDYVIIKKKLNIENKNVDELLKKVEKHFIKYNPITIDGVKIDFEEGWVHIRKSNTEPIIRIYAEAKSKEEAEKLSDSVISQII